VSWRQKELITHLKRTDAVQAKDPCLLTQVTVPYCVPSLVMIDQTIAVKGTFSFFTWMSLIAHPGSFSLSRRQTQREYIPVRFGAWVRSQIKNYRFLHSLDPFAQGLRQDPLDFR
jgi:hypothetical protein